MFVSPNVQESDVVEVKPPGGPSRDLSDMGPPALPDPMRLKRKREIQAHLDSLRTGMWGANQSIR